MSSVPECGFCTRCPAVRGGGRVLIGALSVPVAAVGTVRVRFKVVPDLSVLRHLSALGWDHIVLTGDYDWNSGVAERTNVRPLNLYSDDALYGVDDEVVVIPLLIRLRLHRHLQVLRHRPGA